MSKQRNSAFITNPADGLRELENAERAIQRRRNSNVLSRRFYMKPGEKPRTVIVLDEAPEFFQYEHNLPDPSTGNQWGLYVGCVDSFDVCPICSSTNRASQYGLYLTVVDTTPFKTKKGDVVKFSRKLFVVPKSKINRFVRMWEAQKKVGKSLRGVAIKCVRDGDRDPRIGSEFEVVGTLSEDRLKSIVNKWTDGEGKVHIDNLGFPFVYKDIFEEPTRENLLRYVSNPVDVIGSDSFNNSLDDDSDDMDLLSEITGSSDDSEDDIPFNLDETDSSEDENENFSEDEGSLFDDDSEGDSADDDPFGDDEGVSFEIEEDGEEDTAPPRRTRRRRSAR